MRFAAIDAPAEIGDVRVKIAGWIELHGVAREEERGACRVPILDCSTKIRQRLAQAMMGGFLRRLWSQKSR